MKTKELPKWFDGELYIKGDVVKNPYSGDKYELNAAELSMYDFIKGAEIMLGTGDIFEKKSSQIQNEMKDFEDLPENIKIDDENTTINITFTFELLLQSYSLFTFSTIIETIISQIFSSEMKNFYKNFSIVYN